MDFLIASHNMKKREELQRILAPLGISVYFDFECGVILNEVIEDGATFAENALKKARSGCADSMMPCIADDSGLCIDALDGAPGVQSARYMGHDTSYEIKNAAILDLLRDVPEERRGAQFVCAVAAVLPGGSDHVETGVMEGQIAYEVSGNGGFGYDPLFYLPEYGMTSADITEERKNAISHRGKALRQMMVYLAGEGLCEY